MSSGNCNLLRMENLEQPEQIFGVKVGQNSNYRIF